MTQPTVVSLYTFLRTLKMDAMLRWRAYADPHAGIYISDNDGGFVRLSDFAPLTSLPPRSTLVVKNIIETMGVQTAIRNPSGVDAASRNEFIEKTLPDFALLLAHSGHHTIGNVTSTELLRYFESMSTPQELRDSPLLPFIQYVRLLCGKRLINETVSSHPRAVLSYTKDSRPSPSPSPRRDDAYASYSYNDDAAAFSTPRRLLHDDRRYHNDEQHTSTTFTTPCSVPCKHARQVPQYVDEPAFSARASLDVNTLSRRTHAPDASVHTAADDEKKTHSGFPVSMPLMSPTPSPTPILPIPSPSPSPSPSPLPSPHSSSPTPPASASRSRSRMVLDGITSAISRVLPFGSTVTSQVSADIDVGVGVDVHPDPAVDQAGVVYITSHTAHCYHVKGTTCPTAVIPIAIADIGVRQPCGRCVVKGRAAATRHTLASRVVTGSPSLSLPPPLSPPSTHTRPSAPLSPPALLPRGPLPAVLEGDGGDLLYAVTSTVPGLTSLADYAGALGGVIILHDPKCSRIQAALLEGRYYCDTKMGWSRSGIAVRGEARGCPKCK